MGKPLLFTVFVIYTIAMYFEGEIRETTLENLTRGLKKIIESHDRVIIYQLKTDAYLERIKIGDQNQDVNNVI